MIWWYSETRKKKMITKLPLIVYVLKYQKVKYLLKKNYKNIRKLSKSMFALYRQYHSIYTYNNPKLLISNDYINFLITDNPFLLTFQFTL